MPPSLFTGYRPARIRSVESAVSALSEVSDRLYLPLVSLPDVRTLTAFLSVAPLSDSSPYRTVVLDCDHASAVAQNALLHILEEPPPSAAFVLHCEHESSVLATIRSRCVCVNHTIEGFGRTTADLVQQGQAMASAAILAAQLVRGFSEEIAPTERSKSKAADLLAEASRGNIDLAVRLCEDFDETCLVSLRTLLCSKPALSRSSLLTLLDLSMRGADASGSAILVLAELLRGLRI